MAAEESGRVGFRAWLVRVFPAEPYIGRFFALLFWGYFGATYISYLLDGREYGLVIVTLAFAALLICWLLLPWRPWVPRYRLLGAPAAFVVASFIVVHLDRKSTRLNSSHANISYAVFCLKKKK